MSAVTFNEAAAHIVRMRKDAHEQRLDKIVAYYIASVIPPEWLRANPLFCPIPSDAKTLRVRGFDHGYSLAQATAQKVGAPCTQLLVTNKQHDQRLLDREQRFANMIGSFAPAVTDMPQTVVIVDDVYTTGASLMAASLTLRTVGVKHIYCATFAHVY